MIWLSKRSTFDAAGCFEPDSLRAGCTASVRNQTRIVNRPHTPDIRVTARLFCTKRGVAPGEEWKLLAVLSGPTNGHARKLKEADMQIGVETSKAVDQRRVFVIDEDEITRAALQFMLHDEIETHELASPEEAYTKGVGWLQPHVVLLGVSFLRQRGNALISELTAKFPGVRILIVCAKSDEAVAVEGLKAGAHGAMVKPLTLEAVRKKVDTILGRGGASPLVQLSVL
jgi:CheY-like chemotaxis protein